MCCPIQCNIYCTISHSCDMCMCVIKWVKLEKVFILIKLLRLIFMFRLIFIIVFIFIFNRYLLSYSYLTDIYYHIHIHIYLSGCNMYLSEHKIDIYYHIHIHIYRTLNHISVQVQYVSVRVQYIDIYYHIHINIHIYLSKRNIYVVRRRGRLAPRQQLSVCTLLPAYEGNRHLRPLGNLCHRLRRPRWID